MAQETGATGDAESYGFPKDEVQLGPSADVPPPDDTKLKSIL
jgi:hypothetical protein